MTKIMPVFDLDCGQRSCITRSDRRGLRPCEWYRQRGLDPEKHARCLLFNNSTLVKRFIGEYAFGVRCAECLAAERRFFQVQLNTEQLLTQMSETMRDGLTSIVEAQETIGKRAVIRGG